jgi:hypothetical protein
VISGDEAKTSSGVCTKVYDRRLPDGQKTVRLPVSSQSPARKLSRDGKARTAAYTRQSDGWTNRYTVRAYLQDGGRSLAWEVEFDASHPAGGKRDRFVPRNPFPAIVALTAAATAESRGRRSRRLLRPAG